jgi:hypothetical protein
MADRDDTPMTGLYAGALVVEAIIVVLLWLFGRTYL